MLAVGVWFKIIEPAIRFIPPRIKFIQSIQQLIQCSANGFVVVAVIQRPSRRLLVQEWSLKSQVITTDTEVVAVGRTVRKSVRAVAPPSSFPVIMKAGHE